MEQARNVGISGSQALAPKQISFLESVYKNLENLNSKVRQTTDQLRELNDRVFGAVPNDPGPPSVPMTTVADSIMQQLNMVDVALSIMQKEVDRLNKLA